MIKRNFQQEPEELLPQITGQHLLLHSCCAPCSTYVLSYLAQHLSITLYFYNPNILPQREYERRLAEQKSFLNHLSAPYPVTLVEGAYEPALFLRLAKGLEKEPEGGRRCTRCYQLRLEAAAKEALRQEADFFTTTLSVSPHKDAHRLNQIGEELGRQMGVSYLPSDFKKKGGALESVRLSKEYQLYRQDWCGCPFSKAETLRRRNKIQPK